MATLSSPIALIIAISSSGTTPYFALFWAIGILPLAAWRWLAIRWLDRRKAWKAALEPWRFTLR